MFFFKRKSPDCQKETPWVKFANAGGRAPARAGMASGGPSALQPEPLASPPAARAVTTLLEMCAITGHFVKARPWIEYPGHWENWGRAVRCDCGAVSHMQFCHHHENPDLAFKGSADEASSV